MSGDRSPYDRRSPNASIDFTDPFRQYAEDVTSIDFTVDMEQPAMDYATHPLLLQDTAFNHFDFSNPRHNPSLLFSPSMEQPSAVYPSGPFANHHPMVQGHLTAPPRHPPIHIDTSFFNPEPLLQVPSEGIATPYDMFPRRPSLTTPSSTGSQLTNLPVTPADHSPVPYPPNYHKGDISPVSPSAALVAAFEQHTVSHALENHPHAAASRTVVEIAKDHTVPSDGILVPQKTYRPHTQSDRRRYVDEVDLEPAIMFFLHNPDRCGISLRDALNGKFMNLVGRDDQMFINRGPSVSIRLMWPGYAPWSRQIPTRDFRTPPQPITRAKLARNVAKTVQRFIDDVEQRQMEEDADPSWRVGAPNIALDDLTLVGLQHVSMGSWQAYVRLRPRRS